MSLNIITYNLFLRPPLVKNNMNDFKNERLSDFIDIMDNYDVICLQEVFNYLTSRKSKIIKQAFKKGFINPP